jgi:LemA protein
MTILLTVIILVILVIVAASIFTYNELVLRKNKVENSWAHIDAQLQRRFELIPNLVELVEHFTEHEKELLENVNLIKNNYATAISNAQKLAMDLELDSELKSLYIVVDRYPALKSNEQFLKLQEVLTEIEEDITFARQFYNDAVTIYNNRIMSFPGNIIAAKFGFKKEALFDANKDAESIQRLNLGKNKKCSICGAAIVSNSHSCPYCGTSY